MFLDSDYYYYKYIDNSIYKILNNSSFKLIKNEEGIIEYTEIKFDDYIIKYDELNNKNIQKNNKLKESYDKFLQLLNDIKNELENKCKNLNALNLELMFKMEKENNSKDSNLFNLTCIYKLNDDDSNEFKDKDILKLKNISDSNDGFLKLTTKISDYSKENNISELTDFSKEAIKSNMSSNNNNKLIDKNHSNNFNHNLSLGSSRGTSNSTQSNKSERNISSNNSYKLFIDFIKIKEDEDNKKNIYNIIALEEKVEYESECEFIKEIQNRFLIVGFLNGKLILFDQNLMHIKELKISYDENKNNDNDNNNVKVPPVLLNIP